MSLCPFFSLFPLSRPLPAIALASPQSPTLAKAALPECRPYARYERSTNGWGDEHTLVHRCAAGSSVAPPQSSGHPPSSTSSPYGGTPPSL
ncbi:hypothetical protein TIFTF001_018092 [Ficus carica]|uniref:Uncharacterized protein n=1 Tax=Ficus carica TaxID=3494 RepID=A0AA88AMC6_FICCA|nr:hypothetical protein TIFTF001_018092 [Ficus carica]